MSLQKRIESALKREAGVRLSAAEVQGLAASLGIGIAPPFKRQSVIRQPIQKQESIDVHIRWMIRRDWPEVLDIERDSYSYPWAEEDFLRCLRQRNCIGMVTEHDERVIGYMIYELHKDRLHVLNLAVAKVHRGKTVGKQMVQKLIGKLSLERRNRIEVELPDFNISGQKFLSAVGFKAVGVSPGWFDRSGADAIEFQHRVDGVYEFKKQAGQPKSTWVDSDSDDDDLLSA